MGTLTVAEAIAYAEAKKAQGNWYPACNGTEIPFFTQTGRRLLYVWQPSTGNHAYLDTMSDIILSNDEADVAFGRR